MIFEFGLYRVDVDMERTRRLMEEMKEGPL